MGRRHLRRCADGAVLHTDAVMDSARLGRHGGCRRVSRRHTQLRLAVDQAAGVAERQRRLHRARARHRPAPAAGARPRAADRDAHATFTPPRTATATRRRRSRHAHGDRTPTLTSTPTLTFTPTRHRPSRHPDSRSPLRRPAAAPAANSRSPPASHSSSSRTRAARTTSWCGMGQGGGDVAGRTRQPREHDDVTLCVYDQSGGTPILTLSALARGRHLRREALLERDGKGFKYPTRRRNGRHQERPAHSGGAGGPRSSSRARDRARHAQSAVGAGRRSGRAAQENGVDGRCWEAHLTAPANRNDGGQFRDKGDAPLPTPTRTASAPATVTPQPRPPRHASPLGPTATRTATPTETPTPPGGSRGDPQRSARRAPRRRCRRRCAATDSSSPAKPAPPARRTASSRPARRPPDALVRRAIHRRRRHGADHGHRAVGYRSDLVSIPGSGNAVSVRQRITYPPPLPNVVSPNDLDYALRLVVGRAGAFPTDCLRRSVRSCRGAPAATPADFGCTVEACAGSRRRRSRGAPARSRCREAAPPGAAVRWSTHAPHRSQWRRTHVAADRPRHTGSTRIPPRHKCATAAPVGVVA